MTMKYLSFDLEATGLGENDLIIEFAMVPFSSKDRTIKQDLQKHMFVKCPPFETLKNKLDPWVVEHNEELIHKAHKEGLSINEFKKQIQNYVNSKEVKDYFRDTPKEKIILFGKSLNAIDLPFLNRDLGWNFMREHFHHQVLDLSSVVMSWIDAGKLPSQCLSGSGLMKHLNMGEVAHTALEDAINTAEIYFKLLDILE